jgi:hypothetical protein
MRSKGHAHFLGWPKISPRKLATDIFHLFPIGFYVKARVLRPRRAKFVKPDRSAIVLYEKHHPRAFGALGKAGGLPILATLPGVVYRSRVAGPPDS